MRPRLSRAASPSQTRTTPSSAWCWARTQAMASKTTSASLRSTCPTRTPSSTQGNTTRRRMRCGIVGCAWVGKSIRPRRNDGGGEGGRGARSIT
eukprot:349682-Chlamydomonas_euryale.AAC.13